MLSKVKAVIEERGISRNRLAMMSGITPSAIYNLFNGNVPLYPGWKRRIAEALDMDESDLFPEGGESNEKE